MTTTRQKLLMLAAILGLSAWCSYELLQGWAWNGLMFGLLAVSCAAMLVAQVGEEQRPMRVGPRRRPRACGVARRYWYVEHGRTVLWAIRSSRNWTWRVKR